MKGRSSLPIMSVALIVLAMCACGARAEYKYVYEMRVLVEARYGDSPDKFGQKDWGDGPMGAICFDIDSAGGVYIYDGPKGDVKVYNREGVYQRTVKALPWIVGGQMLADMSVGPTGVIYVLVDTYRRDERMRLYRISPDGKEPEQLPFVLAQGQAMMDGVPIMGSLRITAEMNGDVYVSDLRGGQSMRVVKSGTAITEGDELASMRPGRPWKWGLWVVDDSLRTSKSRGIGVYRSDGILKSRLAGVSGSICGVDSAGSVYVHMSESRRVSEWKSWMDVLSPRGVLEARIDFPKIPGSGEVYGKGMERLIGLDGSVYILRGEDDRVRAYKWERKVVK